MHGKSDPVPLTGFSARETIVASEIVGRLMSVRIGVGKSSLYGIRNISRIPMPGGSLAFGAKETSDFEFHAASISLGPAYMQSTTHLCSLRREVSQLSVV